MKKLIVVLAMLCVAGVVLAETDYVAMPYIDAIRSGSTGAEAPVDLYASDDVTSGDDLVSTDDVSVGDDLTVVGLSTLRDGVVISTNAVAANSVIKGYFGVLGTQLVFVTAGVTNVVHDDVLH